MRSKKMTTAESPKLPIQYTLCPLGDMKSRVYIGVCFSYTCSCFITYCWTILIMITYHQGHFQKNHLLGPNLTFFHFWTLQGHHEKLNIFTYFVIIVHYIKNLFLSYVLIFLLITPNSPTPMMLIF